MAKKKEPTVEEKLRALYDLQLIDSRIDKIRDIEEYFDILNKVKEKR